MVSTAPLASPASLNLITRLLPLWDTLVAFLMKCGLPLAAKAPVAAATTNPAARPTTARTCRACRNFVLPDDSGRSEEHTSELQSRPHLVCRLLLEKKKTKRIN